MLFSMEIGLCSVKIMAIWPNRLPYGGRSTRQLYETGWMHNRVRMVVASFLVKHLLLSLQTELVGFGTH